MWKIKPLGVLLILAMLAGVGYGLYTLVSPMVGRLPSQAIPTPEIVLKTATPVPPTKPAVQPTAKTAAAQPTAVQVTPIPQTAVPTVKGQATPVPTTIVVAPTKQPGTTTQARPVLTVALDAFGSYFPALQVAQDPNREVDLNIIPFNFDKQYEFTEVERAAKISSGEWDILLTTGDSLAKKGNIGKIIAMVDQSAGADKVAARPTGMDGKPINYFNDLKGKVITFSEGSVGHYQVLALLRVVLLTPTDVKFLPAASVADAVQNFLDKKADAVAGWEPDINGALDAGGKELVSTAWFS